MNSKSPYEILGVGKYSSQKEIRRKYLELCKQYHPDVSKIKNATQHFTDIKYAYEVLTHKSIPQPLISARQPTTVIDTRMWTRRSIVGGVGLMAFVVWYMSSNEQVSMDVPPVKSSAALWKESGLSYRQWRQQ